MPATTTMLLATLVETSAAVAATRSRSAKIERLAALLAQLSPAEAEIGVAYLTGRTRQGRLGVGYKQVHELRDVPAAAAPTLTIAGVDAELERLHKIAGAGAVAARRELLTALFAAATRVEQDFLARVLIGELRQGALEGIMLDAIARAAHVGIGAVRRAAMLAGDLALIARVARAEGAPGLARFSLTLFEPVQPMLAQSADGVDAALAQLGCAQLELKVDGARVQIHKDGSEVRVYTRALNEVTAAVPELVERVRELPVQSLVLDGEAVALRPDGTPLPFQVTMRRFGRKLDVASARAQLPLSVLAFDCLHTDGGDLIDLGVAERFAALREHLPASLLIPHLVTADAAAAAAFLAQARARGHEGIMAKDLNSRYEAGRRGGAWLKVKPAHTLDLVVLAAEWGSGRRRGWLSNLHLGARDPATGGFVMLGKTFKGMTDEMLAWQTAKLLELEVARDAYTVHVRPELVLEIAFNDVQRSPHYPGGLALRFARVKRYRPDKSPADADTIATVAAAAPPQE